MQVSGTIGGSLTDSIYGTRVLNNLISNQIINASLFSNRITLPAGTYFIQAECPMLASISTNTLVNFNAVSRLRNITDSSTAIDGLQTVGFVQSLSTTQSSTTAHNLVNGKFTIAATKVFELQSQGISPFPGTVSFLSSTTNVFIWKIG